MAWLLCFLIGVGFGVLIAKGDRAYMESLRTLGKDHPDL